jgi:tRNA(Arg) A34 adenosine deaminase TadA
MGAQVWLSMGVLAQGEGRKTEELLLASRLLTTLEICFMCFEAALNVSWQ